MSNRLIVQLKLCLALIAIGTCLATQEVTKADDVFRLCVAEATLCQFHESIPNSRFLMSTPMNHLTDIRQHLERELQDRISRADAIDNRLRQPGLEDWEEQATQRENDEVLESLGRQAVQEIEQIKQAIHRIDEGTYGVCSHCGSPIAPERLEAMPYATTCIECV